MTNINSYFKNKQKTRDDLNDSLSTPPSQKKEKSIAPFN